MDDDHDEDDGHGGDQMLKLRKKERENKKAQGKRIFDRSFLF